MEKKKIIILGIIALVIVILIYIFSNFIEIESKQNKIEIQPEEEISEEQLRQTTVTLFYKNKETNMLDTETRNIDVKELLDNPYMVLISMLIEGPKSDNLEKIMPDGTKVLKAEQKSDTLELNLSKEFIANCKDVNEENLRIYSIVNTLTELREINNVKINIEGEENKSFENGTITFESPFTRIEEINV